VNQIRFKGGKSGPIAEKKVCISSLALPLVHEGSAPAFFRNLRTWFLSGTRYPPRRFWDPKINQLGPKPKLFPSSPFPLYMLKTLTSALGSRLTDSRKNLYQTAQDASKVHQLSPTFTQYNHFTLEIYMYIYFKIIYAFEFLICLYINDRRDHWF
jgi:hypothetical protein